MLKKNFLLLIVVLGFTVPALNVNSGIAAPVKTSTTLKPTEIEEEASIYISQNLQQKHFRKVSVNDSLSQQIFYRYLDNLDHSKNYFLASDVESMKKSYGTRIGIELRDGKTNAGFAIYNLFLRRAKEKMLFMKAAVDTVHFTFSTKDTLNLDRKMEPWPADRRQLTGLWKKELK